LEIEGYKNIVNQVLPHFNNYPLQTDKLNDFFKFKEILKMMEKKNHLTEDGLRTIIHLKSKMNNGILKKFKEDGSVLKDKG